MTEETGDVAHARPRGGFTLVETVVVLAVLGVLATFAAVRYTSALDQTRRRAGHAEIVTQARERSAEYGFDVRVTVDDAYRSAEVHEDRNNNGAIDEGEPVFMVPLDRPRFPPVQFDTTHSVLAAPDSAG
jgi:prepilin-type N-terminal cleavage/methylation domain-containing protein